VGNISGAHLNPAVTFGFWMSGRFPGKKVAPYALSQLGGAMLASAALRGLFPSHSTLGATLPAGPASQSFALETLLAFVLMFVILNVSTDAKERGMMAGVAIGGVVGIEALFAGPITGASMNPARSIAPALVSGHTHHLWIYLVAPLLGAYLAIWGCRGVQANGCCGARQEPCG
jgi:aquaporin Z